LEGILEKSGFVESKGGEALAADQLYYCLLSVAERSLAGQVASLVSSSFESDAMSLLEVSQCVLVDVIPVGVGGFPA